MIFLDRSGLRRLIKNYLDDVAPGLHIVLELRCKIIGGRDLVSLLIDDPGKLLKALKTMYNDESSVEFVVRLILKPLVQELELLGKEEQLVKQLLENPEKFKEEISRLLEQRR